MKKLLRYLSPFAPDQSGVCGVLYELGGLIVVCDAGGCAGNICGFDEPRWFTKKSAVFSAGLRDMDAIMGRDDKLIEKLRDAQEKLNCKFTALIATPVPAVIGTDMKALKRMAEKKTGVPCISINAIGTRYFDEGENDTWYELMKEFAGGAKAKGEESDIVEGVKHPESTGIIGATPLETGYSSPEMLLRGCTKYNIKNPVIYGLGTGLDEIRNADKVTKNIVVSAAGIKAAKYLEERFGIPYETGYPFIPEKVIDDVRTLLEEKVATGKSDIRILIIHSQFAANELRNIIRNEFSTMIQNGSRNDMQNEIRNDMQNESDVTIDAATFFMMNDDYKEDGDLRLSGEDELWDMASHNQYDMIIADEDIERLLKAAGFQGGFAAFPEFAISGRPLDEGKTLYDFRS